MCRGVGYGEVAHIPCLSIRSKDGGNLPRRPHVQATCVIVHVLDLAPKPRVLHMNPPCYSAPFTALRSLHAVLYSASCALHTVSCGSTLRVHRPSRCCACLAPSHAARASLLAVLHVLRSLPRRRRRRSCPGAQAGNMAHLLNHSCDPNCYSRLTGVWDPAAGMSLQHVMLYAKRSIAAEEELTYDYRWVGSPGRHTVRQPAHHPVLLRGVLPITSSRCQRARTSHCHFLTLSDSLPVTLSLSHAVTLSVSLSVTVSHPRCQFVRQQ